MIKFFFMDGCPYCIKVQAKLDKLKIKFVPRNINDDENWRELMKIGKKDMVPFIVDGSVAMYESDEIVKYLEEKYGRNKNANRTKSA